MDEKRKNRYVFLEILRVLAAAAVVLMHTVSGVLSGGYDMAGHERRQQAFSALIDACAWCVPVFLMISGFLLLDPKRKITWKDAIFRYCRRIVLALAVFGIPYALLELVMTERTFRAGMLPEAVWRTATGRSWAHMWYLYLILILYAVTPAIKILLQKVPRRVVHSFFALLFLLTCLLPFAEWLWGLKMFFRIPQQAIYFFYYFMGYAFAVRKRKAFPMEGVISFLLFALIELLELWSRFLPGYDLNLAYAYPPTALAALLLFNGCMACEEYWKSGQGSVKAERARELLKHMACLTFGIYLIHPVFLNLFYKFWKLSPMDFPVFLGVPLFWGIAFGGAAIVTWILRKMPLFRRDVL